ncbi:MULTISPECIES: DUF1385 domain-containing protein [Gordonibacter]|uniref:DUF1385 domain-containing protein n=1 Tax=Gordonibacter faecis TaxID=3047475 RepID=A0ABT7DN73_9ACTN|nr:MULTISPECIES: DUF1385 domain-containing protein [unclassified Gordonibacter]MDJ1650985.1 DUF1385 domain-containing protein [Gordonibacter sp. KGMB12511]HIW76948.1 DUF1385 domain-containing protein [Candidatus Gordonibacter avicola]
MSEQEAVVSETSAAGGAKKSDLSRAFSEDGARKTHVGGQALLEGIMMRGKYNWSVAVREPSGGIYLEEHDLASGRSGRGWMHWPLVRGCRALVESLVLGFKALEIAAEHAFLDSDPAEPAEAEEPSETPRSAARPSAEQTGSCASLASFEEKENGGARVSTHSSASAGSSGREDACAAGETLSQEQETGGSLAGEEGGFSWKDDFGRPETMIDALGAQTSLEVVSEAESAGVSQAGADAQDDGGKKKSFLDEEAEFGKGAMAVSMVFGLVLGVVLFIVAPAFVTNLIVGEYDGNTLLWNVVDGLLRVAVFVFYLWLIGRMAEIKRMFGYHGAEHKTIHCYEHGLPLTPENARSFPRLHVRCGTAFLIMVMIIAIIVYTVTPLNSLIEAWGVSDGAPKLALVIAVRILLMPVIAGISYEITVKWAGSHPDNPLVKVILWPGMQMQYLTTNEPDDGQIECAIAAMQKVLEREEAEAAKAASLANGTETEERASAAA